MLSSETLRKSIGESAEAVREREAEVDRARHALAEAQREMRLLIELAELRGVPLPRTARDLEAGQATGGAKADSPRRPARGRAALLDNVVEILADAGEPMQIRALMAAVKERDVRIPGRGMQANLISVISRDPRIVRPKRGFYGLREWGK